MSRFDETLPFSDLTSLKPFFTKKRISYYFLWQMSSLLLRVRGEVHEWIKERTNCHIRQLEEFLTGLNWRFSCTNGHSVFVWLSVYVRGGFPKAFLDPNHGVIQYIYEVHNLSILQFVWFGSLFFHKNVLASIKVRGWIEERTNCRIGRFEEFLNCLNWFCQSSILPFCPIWKFVFSQIRPGIQ